jgi:hypothetical protein
MLRVLGAEEGPGCDDCRTGNDGRGNPGMSCSSSESIVRSTHSPGVTILGLNVRAQTRRESRMVTLPVIFKLEVEVLRNSISMPRKGRLRLYSTLREARMGSVYGAAAPFPSIVPLCRKAVVAVGCRDSQPGCEEMERAGCCPPKRPLVPQTAELT